MRTLMTLCIIILTAALVTTAKADEDSEPAGPDPAAMFTQLDANSDGQLSDDEVPDEHKRLFKRLLRTADADEDGRLSGKEFAAGLSEKPQNGDQPDRPGQRRGRPSEGRLDPQMLFRRMDRNGDGKVALDEIPEQRRDRFALLLKRGDQDGDEALSSEEFTQTFPGRPPRGQKPNDGKSPEGRPEGRPDPRQFFERLDTNGDGKVTLDEAPERARPFVERMVKRADKDGDQAVSLEELAALRPGGQHPRANATKGRPGSDARGPNLGIFRALDANHDRKLSEEEISAAATVIRKLDADGDGSVSLEELTASRPARKDKT